MNDDREINDLISRYSVFADDHLMKQLSELFVADGEVSVTGRNVTNGRIAMKGQPQILAWLERLVANGVPLGKHFTSGTLITYESETAAVAQSDMMFVRQTPEHVWSVFELGRYHDRFARTEGGWRFVSRDIAIYS